ncbi:4Fe-4S dicluster domain-containing protein [Desulfovibrio litoralis]|uniref:Heterodisulfide reductase subunit C n=1 Tax=Desulfovibrio litoralis DSM 11393 TaxID=1121455 RepID=A0A1M7T8I7_9BACT|nr:4Fe-4S dicluster domain-containing protein [Desulfovibrio litoralis]SHN67055.1 heterodisulfide reductase subunit C [Desulfovibrio litoralis DSM 11393]
MDNVNLSRSCDRSFTRQVEKASGQNLKNCYQCGNCTAGCPLNAAYDIPVSRMMRLIQLGQKETLLKSKSIWMCASCEACTTRCPNSIDIARVLEVCRHMARKEDYVAEPRVKKFFDSFLLTVAKFGRSFELGVMALYMLRTGRLTTDIDLVPKILPKNKLAFLPHMIQGRKEVEEIFKRYQERNK